MASEMQQALLPWFNAFQQQLDGIDAYCLYEIDCSGVRIRMVAGGSQIARSINGQPLEVNAVTLDAALGALQVLVGTPTTPMD